jgi:hypothetical protein
MPTKIDSDDDLLIPDVSRLDWSNAHFGRDGRQTMEKTEVCLDGAVGYELRLIP